MRSFRFLALAVLLVLAGCSSLEEMAAEQVTIEVCAVDSDGFLHAAGSMPIVDPGWVEEVTVEWFDDSGESLGTGAGEIRTGPDWPDGTPAGFIAKGAAVPAQDVTCEAKSVEPIEELDG